MLRRIKLPFHKSLLGCSFLFPISRPLNILSMAGDDIREDQMTVSNSVDYVRALKGRDRVLIKKEDLVHITPKLNFNGDF